MPAVRPFRALRYDTDRAGAIEDLVAPPYDIIYDEWRERLYARNPHNIIRLIKTRDEAGEGQAQDKYERANDYIEDWLARGVLRFEDQPAVYVRSETYEAEGVRKTRYGFIALLRLEEFGGHVHPHERTLSGPKADRLKLVTATRTNLSQVFSIFRDPDGDIQTMLLDASAAEPEAAFTDEQGIVRRLWVVTDAAFIDRLCALMRDRDVIIADGHHRYETALAYRQRMEAERTSPDEPFDYISMYFSSADADGMTIMPTHRKVLGLDGFDLDDFLTRMGGMFDIEHIGGVSLNDVIERIREGSDATTVFGMYTCDGFRILRLRNPSTPKRLDVDVLHDDIIEGILGITRDDIAAGRYLHFSKSAEHAVEDVVSCNDQLAILMNPVRTNELFGRVLVGERMPQKSTYFYPKTLSGLVMYRIDRTSFE